MRIISGLYRGKKLKSPENLGVRPSHDRLKETLFNIIASNFKNYLHNNNVLDIFAGSGAIGIECISRRANFACFVEKNKDTHKLIKQNIPLPALDKSQIINKDFLSTIKADYHHDFSLVYIDPPYHKELLTRSLIHLIKLQILCEDALIICESAKNEDWSQQSNVGNVNNSFNLQELNLKTILVKDIGKSKITFLQYSKPNISTLAY